MTWPLPYHYPAEFDCCNAAASASMVQNNGYSGTPAALAAAATKKECLWRQGGMTRKTKWGGAWVPLMVTVSALHAPDEKGTLPAPLGLLKFIPGYKAEARKNFPGGWKNGSGIPCQYKKSLPKILKKLGIFEGVQVERI